VEHKCLEHLLEIMPEEYVIEKLLNSYLFARAYLPIPERVEFISRVNGEYAIKAEWEFPSQKIIFSSANL